MDVVVASHALGDPTLPAEATIRDGVRASSDALPDSKAQALARAAVDTVESFTSFAGCSGDGTDHRTSVIIVRVERDALVRPGGLWRPYTDVSELAQFDGGTWCDVTLTDYPTEDPFGGRMLPAGWWRLTGTIDNQELLEGAGLEAIVRVAAVLFDIAPGSPTPGTIIRAAGAAPLLTRWMDRGGELL